MPTEIAVKEADYIKKNLELPKLAPMKEVYQRIGQIVSRLSSFVIKNSDDYDAAMVAAKDAKGIIKNLKAAEESIIENPQGFVKSVQNLRKMIERPLAVGLDELDSKMTRFQNEQFEKRRKEEEALRLKASQEAAKIAEANTSKEAAKIETKVAKIEAKAEAIAEYKPKTVDRERKFEVIDPDKVDRQYCSPDDKKIKPFIGKCDGPIPNIPGVRIWDTAKIVKR